MDPARFARPLLVGGPWGGRGSARKGLESAGEGEGGRWGVSPPRKDSRVTPAGPHGRADGRACRGRRRGRAGAPAPPPLPRGPDSEPLARLARGCEQFILRPRRYFTAWGGVLTLAFDGVPGQAGELKRALEEALPGLPQENFGSKWPKVSLGCLRDGRTLTRDELGALDRLCTELSHDFGEDLRKSLGNLGREPPRLVRDLLEITGGGLLVDHLELVLFACRSLEKRLHTTTLCLGDKIKWPQDIDASVTDGVLAERLADNYWDGVAQAGNREAHYREAAWGATLVAPVGWDERSVGTTGCPRAFFPTLQLAVRAFRLKVDELLPGAYAWFSTDSLHVTVRGLFG